MQILTDANVSDEVVEELGRIAGVYWESLSGIPNEAKHQIIHDWAHAVHNKLYPDY